MKKVYLQQIQKRLREAIASSGLTQKEIARQIGVNPSTISKYVRLDKYPSLDTFGLLCKVLDVSADEILGIK